MDKKTKGAWLLAQSKSLDAVQGARAARLENISYAGRVGRLYNLLRRNVAGDPNPTIQKQTVDTICKLNGIDKAMRQQGLELLKSAGRIDVGDNGAVIVLGATTTAAEGCRGANANRSKDAPILLNITYASQQMVSASQRC